MRTAIKHELLRLINRRECWILLLASIVLAGVALIEKILVHGHVYKDYAISAVQASMLWKSGVGYVYVLCLVPLFSSLVFSDQFYRDFSDHSLYIVITRHNKTHYFKSLLLVSFISGFIFAILPLLINLLLCLIAFPIKAASPTETGSIYVTSLAKEIQWVLFPRLYMNYPVLNTITHIFLSGLIGANFAALSFTLTLYFQKNAIIAACSSTIIYLIYSIAASMLGLYTIAPFHFMLTAPEGYNKSILIFIGFIFVLMVCNLFLYKRKSQMHDYIRGE